MKETFFSIFKCNFFKMSKIWDFQESKQNHLGCQKASYVQSLSSSSMREKAILAEQSQPHLLVAQAQSLFLMGVELSA